jgi:hypothetical protein
VGAYCRGWLQWGAIVMGWPPDVTRRQRTGDLCTVADRMMELDRQRELAREG